MRLMRYARTEPSLEDILQRTKTKRYAMSRLRRMVLCAYLGLTTGDSAGVPPCTRVLAMNDTGRLLLRRLREVSEIPVLTKPAAGRELTGRAAHILTLEERACALWGLAAPMKQRGDIFYTKSPVRCEKEE